MGIFQANMLEAMKFLREDFQKSIQKTSSQVEVDQTSASASKPGPSNTVHLDPSPPRPRPLSHSVDSKEVALRYYLDRTKDLRGSQSLLFISFKKGHTSDIRPTTLSSWLKQTILLCYKQADQQALDLVQVKAHDIRAFAASKAFYGGVSVHQIMQACHWKAHNTFINFT